jgi:photosystem II stability/assembly factor-like uncharacterized protein
MNGRFVLQPLKEWLLIRMANMRKQIWLIGVALAISAHAQWQLQESHTTADLRGIHNVGHGVAWASGTNGTVVRTLDGGDQWQTCAVPDGAEHLDFRGIQAFDANTAIVMSSGKGELSRLYKTADGCRTWKLVFTNPDKDGFWDAIVVHQRMGLVVGDPVDGRFAIFASSDGLLDSWSRFGETSDYKHFRFEPSPYEGEGLFAASNSVAKGSPASGLIFVTGGPKGAKYAMGIWQERGPSGYPTAAFSKTPIPLAVGKSAGAFSFDCYSRKNSEAKLTCVTVGGDYLLPDSRVGVAASASHPERKWKASKAPPHGYRSAVAYDQALKTWITVGPNGTDISTDDGKNWRAVHPDQALNEAPDADRNWNALSLPFVVGLKGRIGNLDRTRF